MIEYLMNYGQRNLVGFSPWGRKKSDTTERLHFHFGLGGQNEAGQMLKEFCQDGHSKHYLPTTQEKILHMDITRWSTPKSDGLYSLQPKMEKLYIVSKNKTES